MLMGLVVTVPMFYRCGELDTFKQIGVEVL